MKSDLADGLLYFLALLIALGTVRKILAKSKPPAVRPVKPAHDAEIERRLQVLEALLDQAPDP